METSERKRLPLLSVPLVAGCGKPLVLSYQFAMAPQAQIPVAQTYIFNIRHGIRCARHSAAIGALGGGLADSGTREYDCEERDGK
jgi:hypothetical protein